MEQIFRYATALKMQRFYTIFKVGNRNSRHHRLKMSKCLLSGAKRLNDKIGGGSIDNQRWFCAIRSWYEINLEAKLGATASNIGYIMTHVSNFRHPESQMHWNRCLRFFCHNRSLSLTIRFRIGENGKRFSNGKFFDLWYMYRSQIIFIFL